MCRLHNVVFQWTPPDLALVEPLLERVIDVVVRRYNVSREALLRHDRHQLVGYARTVLMSASYTYVHGLFRQRKFLCSGRYDVGSIIARALNRHPSTVFHAKRRARRDARCKRDVGLILAILAKQDELSMIPPAPLSQQGSLGQAGRGYWDLNQYAYPGSADAAPSENGRIAR